MPAPCTFRQLLLQALAATRSGKGDLPQFCATSDKTLGEPFRVGARGGSKQRAQPPGRGPHLAELIKHRKVY